THSATVTLTVAASSGISNGGFESGLASWTSAGSTAVATTAHSGASAAKVGSSSPFNGDSSVAQTFTAPSGGGVLSFWYRVVCTDSVTYDWATATLRDNTTATTTTVLARTCSNTGLWNSASATLTATLKDNTTGTTTTLLARTCSNTGVWNSTSFTLTGGHSYTLTLIDHDDNYATDPTYTLYDDVTIN